jgi:cytochrome b subunit of formate dehydrogenase
VVFASLVFFVGAKAQSREECLACHGDKSLTMERKGKQVSLFVESAAFEKSSHKKASCVSCHVGFDAQNVPHKAKIDPVNCKACHKDAPAKHQFHPQMNFATGGKGNSGLVCKDCHGTHEIVSSKEPGSRFNTSKLTDFCGSCHADVGRTFAQSSHRHAQIAGVKGAPSCIECHRNSIAHVTATQDTTQLKIAQEKLCLSCHLDDPNVKAAMSPTTGFIAAYAGSVHGAALQRGNGKAANCVDCHGSHEMKKGADPTSRVAKANIPQTCAKCHANVANEFNFSVHGLAVKNGNMSAPVCTDCHGEHNILKTSDPRSPVASGNVSSQVCSPCHSSVKLNQKFGLASDRFKSFSDSYHGLAGKAGSVQVANCASCHGVHDIKRSSDPTSRINKANLVKTCGTCHPGANENFTKGAVHIVATEKKDDILSVVSTAYVILIIVTVGGMFFHNLLDFIKKSKRQLMYRRGIIPWPAVGHRLYLRMSFSERIQHATLLTSFITLVLTGFALKYPDAWWVVPFRDISPVMFELRGILHRVAAVVMVSASLYHIYYVFFVPRGKQLIRDLLPKLEDASDAIGVFRYNLGFASVKPKFARFSYAEKAEYWALIWGTIVMAGTGVILWFDNTFLGLLTKLWWDVARTVHYYEAWLATLSIIVWHFYFVIFNPDIYPINLAFWKGTLTEEEMEEEHPLELESIRHAEVKREMEKASDLEHQKDMGTKK